MKNQNYEKRFTQTSKKAEKTKALDSLNLQPEFSLQNPHSKVLTPKHCLNFKTYLNMWDYKIHL